MKKILAVIILSCISLISCASKNNADHLNQKQNELSYTQNSPWVKKLRDLKRGKNVKFRIIQIGDSHTAGDYFSDELRTQLQRALGNGGIGLISPTAVRGQRNAQVKYQNGKWQTLTSRKQQADFPLGGVVAQNMDQSRVTLSPFTDTFEKQHIQFYAKPQSSSATLLVSDMLGHSQLLKAQSNHWQALDASLALPINYSAQNGFWSLGQIRIENPHKGIVLSAMGINGAQLSHTERWHSGWVNELKQAEADLIILAFGTNEATNERLDISETEQIWTKIIQQIRQSSPNTGILIVGAPESLSNTRGLCGERLVMLDSVQAMQQRLAKKMNVSYWSWQNTMGGHCSMKPWIAKGLARPDGIHFSAEGYQQAARNLAQTLIQIAKQ